MTNEDKSFDFMFEPESVIVPVYPSELEIGRNYGVLILDVCNPLRGEFERSMDYIRFTSLNLFGLPESEPLATRSLSMNYNAFKYAWVRYGIRLPVDSRKLDLAVVIKRTTIRRLRFIYPKLLYSGGYDVKEILEEYSKYDDYVPIKEETIKQEGDTDGSK